MKRYILIIIAILTFFASSQVHAAEQGSANQKVTYRYDFKRSGYTDAQVRPPLELGWFFNTNLSDEYIYNPKINCSLIGEGSRLYFGTFNKTFTAFDTEKRAIIWQFKTEGDVHAGATMDGEKIFFGDSKGFLYCLNKNSGKLMWQRSYDNEILSSPLVAADRLYFSDMSDTLYSISTQTGDAKWKVAVENYLNNIVMRGVTSPAYSDGLIYQGASDGYLYCFDAETSEEKYRKKVKGGGKFYDVDAPAAVEGKVVYSSSYDGNLIAVSSDEPKTKWSAKVKGNSYSAFNKDALIVSSSEGALYRINKDVGSVVWESELSEHLTAPVITNDHIFVASEDFFYVVDINSGEVEYEYEPGSGINSELCLIGDRVYFVSNKGYLYCFKSK